MTTISKMHTGFIDAMVQSAYKFDTKYTKTINEPLMSDCELRDYYCAFCGCSEKPINEPFCWPACPQCKGV
jgi:hypothetical protein